MKIFGKKRIALISAALLILIACIGMTVFLLFSNYRNVVLFKQAQSDFLRGDDTSLNAAEAQLLQLIRNDDDNETAYLMLASIAGQRKAYPEQVYYSYMAHKLNPLSAENKAKYINSLLFAREFERLENFLSYQSNLSDDLKQVQLYAAGRNGNIKKYKTQLKHSETDKNIGALAFLLFAQDDLSIQKKLSVIENEFQTGDPFLQQELFAAQSELYLKSGNLDDSEKALLKAYALNEFAFAPALGRFYANFRTFGQSLEIFEKYLKKYHDQAIAVQTAEIYCLLKKTEKIAELRKDYQSDSGSGGMLCCYYFDALTALANGDMAALKELTVPLRKNINTPVAAFLFFCADVSGDDPAAVLASYQALHSHRNYLDLQSRADNMVSDFLQRSLTAPAEKNGQFFALAETLYKRRPDVFTAKFILLFQKRSKSVDAVLLNDALKRFGKDPGIIKIAIEHYFNHDLSKVKELITEYRNLFPARKGDILRYEIVLALKEKDFDGASRLFMENFTQDIRSEYWQFASTTLREKDLQFLRKDPLYAPFCQALLLLKKNDNDSAYRLLEVADAQGNQDLLFFAAKTLGENGKAQAALKKYSTFPENSRYRIVVLLNMAELLTETGDLDQALILSNRAYTLSPQIPETQLCYADKLYKKGRLGDIPDIIKNFATSPYRKEMETLWIAGMQQRIKDCNISTQREKTRELCRQLLVVSPDNTIAQEYLKKLRQMPQ